MKIDYKWTVAKEGYLPIFISIFTTWLATAFLGLSIFSLLFFIILLLIIYFFRDPERIIPSGEGIICPADGKIITIDNSVENEFIKSEMTRACIFLSVFDCHINMSPDKVKVIETDFILELFSSPIQLSQLRMSDYIFILEMKKMKT